MWSSSSPNVVFSATEVVGQLSIDIYSGEPSNTSSCINVDIPDDVAVGQPLVFEGSATSGTINALTAEIGDAIGMFSLRDCNLHWLNQSYDLQEISPGTYPMTVIDWTDDASCSLLVEHSLTVLELITGLNVSTLPAAVTRNESVLELVAWMVDGTGVVVSGDWDDGVVSFASCVNVAHITVIIFKYIYETTGTFAVSVTSENILDSRAAEDQAISVYERIQDLTIYGNSSVLTPPGTGIWKVATGTDQLPLENLVCVWNMGTDYGDTIHNVSMLNSSMLHEITFSYGQQADVGIQTINVNCSNAVSCQNLSMDVTVVWDNVTLGELNCNSSTLWNHSITCELTIVHFGTGACFEWDMGDGKPLVYYQDGFCADNVPVGSPNYIQVRSTTSVRRIVIIIASE